MCDQEYLKELEKRIETLEERCNQLEKANKQLNNRTIGLQRIGFKG